MKSFKEFLTESSNDNHHAKVFHDLIKRMHNDYHELSTDENESKSDRTLFAKRSKRLKEVDRHMQSGDHAKAHAHLLKDRSLHDEVCEEASDKEYPSVEHFYKKHGAPGY